MKVYRGKRTSDRQCWVTVTTTGAGKAPTTEALAMTPRGRQHSPTGFEWGYQGSGPAALAHAILADAYGSTEEADRYYQDFKRERIATIDAATFEMTDQDAIDWVLAKLRGSIGAATT